MKRELGIARCGLACCLCSENDRCGGCDSGSCPDKDRCENRRCSLEKGLSGCFACAEECRKGLLGKVRPYAFVQFCRRHGVEALLDRLEEKERHGVVYHRVALEGDYDRWDDPEDVIAFLWEE